MCRHLAVLSCIVVLGLNATAQAQGQSAPLYPGVQANPLDYGQLGPAPMHPGSPSEPTRPTNRYSAQPRESQPPATPSPYQAFSSALYQDHEPLLRGLWELRLGETRINRKNIINVRKRMSTRELLTLIESVDGDGRIYDNAERLSSRLQEGGLLHAGDRVVGYSDGKVYAIIGGLR